MICAEQRCYMLEHLMDEVIYEPEVLTSEDLASAKEIKRTTPQNLLDAQVETTKWLEELGATPDAEIFMQVEEAVSRETFAALSANTTVRPVSGTSRNSRQSGRGLNCAS